MKKFKNKNINKYYERKKFKKFIYINNVFFN